MVVLFCVIFIIKNIMSHLLYLSLLFMLFKVPKSERGDLNLPVFLFAKYTNLFSWKSVHNSDAWVSAGKGSTAVDYQVNVWLY